MTAMARTAAATTIGLHAETAAIAVAAAVEGLHAKGVTSASATAVASATALRAGLPASATLAHKCGSTAAIAMVAAVMAASMGPRSCRGRDRQRGNAGCEENPGHNLSPLNGRTVRSAHRSNR
jgi:hypothetical protein